ncbi:hypothetical protein MOA67_gp137 [Klebsiella phage KpLz-2_45]|uniref:hypothetical protein n=1 Tax=Klebsiella phage KpLz-2_45 TaxID=2698923 RepID=UPI001F12BCCF|nr:hypothetical protein MOA67_gp137 [Klebsiella phage KpLz-2_45]UKS72003.1 hypothetical protein KpLz245_1370 [Klebsiella phage KpLz-2_45]
MAKTRNTPALGLKGKWSLIQPWTASQSLIYQCTAIRFFTEMVAEGIDIFNVYYSPKGLTESDYNADLSAGAAMCVLYSSSGSVITVPDTYIETFPGIGMSNWGQVILSASLGPMRLDLDYSFLKEQMGNLISDTIGVVPEIYVDQLATIEAISTEEADAIEAARLSAITNRTSTYAQNLALQKENAELRIKIQALLAAK